MNKKLLKYLIYLTGAVCLIVFLGARFLPLYNAMLIEERNPEYFEFTNYGELYYFNYVKHFKEDIPLAKYKFRYSTKQADINNAEIITFGDSYFDFNRQQSLPDKLQEKTNKKLHSIYAFYPLNYFKKVNYSSREKKIFIFEITERMIPFRFENPHVEPDHFPERGSLELIKRWAFPENREELYTGLLKGSYLSSPFYSTISTLKFDMFGYISAKTPMFALKDKPWLFYFESVNDQKTSFYYQHSEKEIEAYCNNIEDLFIELKTKYNFDVIFCPIPNKYTVYHKLINEEDEYNNFLPRIYEEMKKRGINYVNLYDQFMNADTLLYYGTDTHWNAKGVDIALGEIIKKIDNK